MSKPWVVIEQNEGYMVDHDSSGDDVDVFFVDYDEAKANETYATEKKSEIMPLPLPGKMKERIVSALDGYGAKPCCPVCGETGYDDPDECSYCQDHGPLAELRDDIDAIESELERIVGPGFDINDSRTVSDSVRLHVRLKKTNERLGPLSDNRFKRRLVSELHRVTDRVLIEVFGVSGEAVAKRERLKDE